VNSVANKYFKTMNNQIKVLITGAAGNLGGLLAKHLKQNENINLNLMFHKKDVAHELKDSKINVIRADLSKKETLYPALKNIDVIVHFAGILFKPNPEKFLPITNTEYFRNLVDVAIEQNVKRIILCSFPHVEGETFPDKPATGKLDGKPTSAHARTRLEEEKYMFLKAENNSFEAVSLRLGMVYGRGILMMDVAKLLAKYWLLGIWKKPTWVHFISTIDFLKAFENAIIKPNIKGIYHLGDDGVQTLQDYFEVACPQWKHKKPWHLPLGLIMTFAHCCEIYSSIFKTRSLLTRDFIKIGYVSYYGDTKRMKEDLLPELKYKTFKEGLETL